jgi:hypothetical protein
MKKSLQTENILKVSNTVVLDGWVVSTVQYEGAAFLPARISTPSSGPTPKSIAAARYALLTDGDKSCNCNTRGVGFLARPEAFSYS